MVLVTEGFTCFRECVYISSVPGKSLWDLQILRNICWLMDRNLFFNFYCYSVTVVCIFSLSLQIKGKGGDGGGRWIWTEIFLSRRTFGQTSNPEKNLAKEKLSQMKAGKKHPKTLCILLCEVMNPCHLVCRSRMINS